MSYFYEVLDYHSCNKDKHKWGFEHIYLAQLTAGNTKIGRQLSIYQMWASIVTNSRETARIPLKDECCTLHGKRKISLEQVFTVTRPTLLQLHVQLARSVYTSDHLCYMRTLINLAFICQMITLLHTHKIYTTDTLVMHRFFFKNIHSNICEGWEAYFSWCAAWKPQLRPRFPHLFVQLEAHSSRP